jgi:hypothetical protein
VDICEEVREEAIRRGLNRSQIKALQKLKEASSEEYQRVTENGHVASNSVGEAETSFAVIDCILLLTPPPSDFW